MILIHSDNINLDLRKADRVAEQTLLHLMGGVILDKMRATHIRSRHSEYSLLNQMESSAVSLD